MILESTQLLNNALIANVPEYVPIYRKTHWNHPASIWCRSSKDNFEWLLNLTNELCKEYTFRYDKVHKCNQYIDQFYKIDLDNFPKGNGELNFVQCMLDEYKRKDPVDGYRAYYLNSKAHLASWKRRDPPFWWVGAI